MRRYVTRNAGVREGAEVLSRFSSRRVEPDHVRPWLAKAGKDGLVSPDLKGRAGSGLTLEAARWWTGLWNQYDDTTRQEESA